MNIDVNETALLKPRLTHSQKQRHHDLQLTPKRTHHRVIMASALAESFQLLVSETYDFLEVIC